MSDFYISKINVGGQEYEIKDAESRSTLALKANLESPTFTGTPKFNGTVSNTTNDQLATVGYVNDAFKANDAMVFKGIVDGSHALPSQDYEVGWTYKVAAAGTYAGQDCEVGDMIVCVAEDGQNSDWAVIQANVDGAVTGPASSGDEHVAIFDGTGGKVVKDSGYTLGKSVPSDAVFTDTHYAATTTEIGSAVAGTEIEAMNGVTFSAGSIAEGSNVASDKISSWSAGSVAEGSNVVSDKISEWSAGSIASGSDVSTDKITSWSTGVLPSLTVSGEVLSFVAGSLPALSYNSVTSTVISSYGEAPTLEYNSVTSTVISSYGSAPTLEYNSVTSTVVTSFGQAPSLTYTTTNIPNISVTPITVATGISEVSA